jgi:hypothetical protein
MRDWGSIRVVTVEGYEIRSAKLVNPLYSLGR